MSDTYSGEENQLLAGALGPKSQRKPESPVIVNDLPRILASVDSLSAFGFSPLVVAFAVDYHRDIKSMAYEIQYLRERLAEMENK